MPTLINKTKHKNNKYVEEQTNERKKKNYHAIPLIHLTSTNHVNFRRQSTSEDVQLNSFNLRKRCQHWKKHTHFK